jgi:DNA-directed RNA polymerase subunit M
MGMVGMGARIKFCPKCGGVMYPRTASGRSELFCTRCGYSEPVESPVYEAYRVVKRIEHSPRERTIVVSANQPPPTASIVRGHTRCPKCGHDELLNWMMQTRSADEPPTRFYRCTKCGHTWREYA